MRAVLNTTGTHVKSTLRVRVDFYPEETDESYKINRVSVPVEPVGGYTGKPEDLNAWIEKLPRIEQVNPCFSHFMAVDETIKADYFHDHLLSIFDPDTIATIDHVLTLPAAAHYLDSIMRSKPTLSPKSVVTQDIVDLCNSTNEKLVSSINITLNKGVVFKVDSGSITVGAGAANYNNARAGNNTYVEGTNAARSSGTGVITTAQFWANANIGGLRYGMFWWNAGPYVCRDSEAIGNVVAGSVQTFSGLTINVELNDKNGVYYTAGNLEMDTVIGDALLTANIAGEYIDPGDSTNYAPSGLYKAMAAYGIGGQMISGNIVPKLISVGMI